MQILLKSIMCMRSGCLQTRKSQHFTTEFRLWVNFLWVKRLDELYVKLFPFTEIQKLGTKCTHRLQMPDRNFFHMNYYCFHRHLSFCPRGKGVCGADTPPHPPSPPDRHTPPADTPLGRHPLGRHPLDRHPPDRHPLPSACWDTPTPGGHCSGRYASYWNAFLGSIKIAYLKES